MGKTFMKRILVLLFFGLLLSGLSGCSERHEQQANSSARPAAQTIRIGIVPEQTIFSQLKRYQPLAAYIGYKTGINIELVLVPRYGNIVESFKTEQLDGAFFGSLTGAMALQSLQVIPVVRPEAKDGSSTYYGMIFVRKDSGIRNGADMQGKRFAFVDKATTAGYLVPLQYFKEEGIADYHIWLSETYFAGTYEDAIYDVLNKKADIGAAKSTVFYRFAQKDSRLQDELEVLATSPEIPGNGLAVKDDFDQHSLTVLKACLLKMDRDPQGREVLNGFGARRFIEATAADYQPALDLAGRLGLGLAMNQKHNATAPDTQGRM